MIQNFVIGFIVFIDNKRIPVCVTRECDIDPMSISHWRKRLSVMHQREIANRLSERGTFGTDNGGI